MRCLSVCLCVCVCVSVCLSVTFVHSVETNKGIFRNFSLLDSQVVLFFPYQTAWQYSNGNPLMGALNAGGVGLNLDSQRISGFVINNCCTVVCILHLATGFLFTAGIGRPSATCCTQSRLSVTVYSSARPTKRGLALYTFMVVREFILWV